MKKWLSQKSNIFFLLIMSLFIANQIPVWAKNFKNMGTDIAVKEYAVINNAKALVNYPPNEKSMTIFWASWCGPCKMEMARLKNSVNTGKIKSSSLFAINPFEDPAIVSKFIQENNYPFTFIDAPDVAHDLKIRSTPTTLFMDKGKIVSNSSGVSVLGIWNAENHLKEN